jgi:hypothetical protein
LGRASRPGEIARTDNVNAPRVVACATIDTVTVAPRWSVPRSHVLCSGPCPEVHVPVLAEMDTVSAAASAESVTRGAIFRPTFRTVAAYVKLPPTRFAAGVAAIDTVRSGAARQTRFPDVMTWTNPA